MANPLAICLISVQALHFYASEVASQCDIEYILPTFRFVQCGEMFLEFRSVQWNASCLGRDKILSALTQKGCQGICAGCCLGHTISATVCTLLANCNLPCYLYVQYMYI